MGKFTVKYLVRRVYKGNVRFYWCPKKKYLVNGQWQQTPLKMRRLSDDMQEAISQAIVLNSELAIWQQGNGVTLPTQGTVAALIVEYKKDERFKRLAPRTQGFYNDCFKCITADLGDFPVAVITRKHARDFYNSFGDTKRKGSAVMSAASVLFNYARDMEIIALNPFSEQRIKKPLARRTIIGPIQIADAIAKAEEMGLRSIAYAIRLGYETGQRPGDLRMLKRSDYDGRWLRVAQSKTGVTVDIPVFKLHGLKSMLDGISHASTLILHEERTGKPYSKDMLSRRVREVFEAAGIGSDIQFRDLRRTAVVRLAEHGCEIAEICAITGHMLKEATTILEVYMPRTRKMAENAIDKVTKLNTH